MLYYFAIYGNLRGMAYKDIWSDVFRAMRHIEKVKADVKTAEDARDREIATLHEAGIPKVQLARRLGFSRPTIDKILKQQNTK